MLMVCTTCTKEEELLTPEGVPSSLKSAQVNSCGEMIYLYSIISEIEAMVEEGSLNEGNGNALNVKITNAMKSIEKCNTSAAGNQLSALINQLEAFVKNGIMEPVPGELLITQAENGIAMLNLINTTWDFLIIFSENTFWHADVTFYADGTTRYDEPDYPGTYLFFGTWSMEGNVLYYVLNPDWPNHYHFTGTLSGNTMSGTWTWGDELKTWTATLK